MVAIAIILGLLPGFAWLFFYLQEDPHPEPARLILLTFVFGAASAALALLIQLALIRPGILVDIGDYARAHVTDITIVGTLLILAFIEEICKFGATYLAVHKNPAFDEPVDAMLYSIIAALGFATIENLGAIMSGGPYQQTALLSDIFQTTSFRFVGATLLHTLTSGIIGYYWARSIRDFGVGRHLTFGIALATVLHAVFNYFILMYGNLLYSVIFVVIVGFFLLNDFEELKAETV